MYDVVLVREILRQIHWSVQTILKRFAPIESPDDFVAFRPAPNLGLLELLGT